MTTRLEVVLPEDTPLGAVRVKPHPGWTAQLVTGAPATPLEVHGAPVTEVVQRIVWTTSGPGIGPIEFDEFEVTAGPLPEVASLTSKALQTYADDEVVRWIEQAAPGAEEPDEPAPVLELAAAEVVDAQPVAATGPVDDGGDGLAVPALALSVLATGLGGAALLRGRRTGRV